MKKKQRATRLAKVTFVCPKCGQKKLITGIQTERMILCPVCGAGMRETE